MKPDSKIKTAILTVSDSRSEDTDISGKVIKKILKDKGFSICNYEIVRDDKEQIKNKLHYFTDILKLDLIFTTGGTGLSPRDVTPEATLEVTEKQVPGLSELMRIQGIKKTKKSILSRGVAGIKNSTLIINLPGSPKAVKESLNIILEVIPHAISMLKGGGH